MAVLADSYVPQAPGSNTRGALNAFDQTSSIMERKQRLNMQQEQQDMERAKFQAFLPAIIAKRDADIASAGASIANAARIEQLRGKAAANSVDYNDRFLNIMSIPDEKERSDTLGAFMGEVAWMDNPALPEYQGFARAVKEERAKSFNDALTNLKLNQHLEETQAAIQGRVDSAMVAADAKKTNAQTYSQSRERIAAINADTKLSVEDKKAQKLGIQVADLQSRAAEAEQAAADAQRDGDTRLAQTFRANAASLRDAVQHTTTFAGSTPSAPRTAAQDPRPTPKPPAEEHPPLTLDGKSLARKLYTIDETTKQPTFAPEVKTPQEVLGAVQQMVSDGAITPEQARATLTKLGFKPKK